MQMSVLHSRLFIARQHLRASERKKSSPHLPHSSLPMEEFITLQNDTLVNLINAAAEFQWRALANIFSAEAPRASNDAGSGNELSLYSLTLCV
jgi:hypothetical protein